VDLDRYLMGGLCKFLSELASASRTQGLFLFDTLYIAFRMSAPARCGVVLMSSEGFDRIRKLRADGQKEVNLDCEVSLLQGR
jgi:hypothetical protein